MFRAKSQCPVMAIAIVAVAASAAVLAAPAGSKLGNKFDVYTDALRVDKPDPFTDGGKTGKFDPYTDGTLHG